MNEQEQDYWAELSDLCMARVQEFARAEQSSAVSYSEEAEDILSKWLGMHSEYTQEIGTEPKRNEVKALLAQVLRENHDLEAAQDQAARMKTIAAEASQKLREAIWPDDSP